MARAIASLLFIKAGWFPLVVRRDDRAQYIEALENADREELRPLIAMFVGAQRSVLIQATEAAYDVPRITSPQSPREAIVAARDRLVQRGKLSLKQWLTAKELAKKLHGVAIPRFDQIKQELQQEIPSVGTGFGFELSNRLQWADADVRARAVLNTGYVANYGEFDLSVQLRLCTGQQSVLGLSFHGVGKHFRGLIGVVAYFVTQGGESIRLKDGIFQINYEEDLAAAQTRFSSWLERIIVEGLNQWRRTL